VNIDPDVMFFRSKQNALRLHENQLLTDLGIIAGLKGASDLPQWMNASDNKNLREFLESHPTVEKKSRYEHCIDGRIVNFSPAVPIPISNKKNPVWIAKYLGMS
jgi:alpha-galactosidase